MNPISWQSKKLDRITKSPLASETSAMSDTADNAFLLKCKLEELFPLSNVKTTCYTDCKSLWDTVQTRTSLEDTRLLVDVGRMREMVDKKEVELKWVFGSEQLADVLTKRGASAEKLLSALNM